MFIHATRHSTCVPSHPRDVGGFRVEVFAYSCQNKPTCACFLCLYIKCLPGVCCSIRLNNYYCSTGIIVAVTVTYISGARAIQGPISGVYEAGTGQIYLDEVRCVGTERMLVDCIASGVGTHNCDHNEDAGVKCEGTVHKKSRILSRKTFPVKIFTPLKLCSCKNSINSEDTFVA